MEQPKSTRGAGHGATCFLRAASYGNMAAPGDKARVLVIDDERVVTETLAVIFSNAGYESRGVESAEAAIALLETEQWVPQFAIVDVHLPGMNGIDLAAILKAQYPQVRVSLFSGRAATADLLEVARQQGHSFDVIAKPVHPSVFLGILASEPLDEAGGESTQPHQKS
jgi:DNA-binding NtrC family response regulator